VSILKSLLALLSSSSQLPFVCVWSRTHKLHSYSILTVAVYMRQKHGKKKKKSNKQQNERLQRARAIQRSSLIEQLSSFRLSQRSFLTEQLSSEELSKRPFLKQSLEHALLVFAIRETWQAGFEPAVFVCCRNEREYAPLTPTLGTFVERILGIMVYIGKGM
jgi:hypothetical protein